MGWTKLSPIERKRDMRRVTKGREGAEEVNISQAMLTGIGQRDC